MPEPKIMSKKQVKRFQDKFYALKNDVSKDRYIKQDKILEEFKANLFYFEGGIKALRQEARNTKFIESRDFGDKICVSRIVVMATPSLENILEEGIVGLINCYTTEKETIGLAFKYTK